MRRLKLRSQINTEKPWEVPEAITKLVKLMISDIVKEGEHRFKRNRVYTVEDLMMHLLVSEIQGISLKEHIAKFGENSEGKPYSKQSLQYRLNNFSAEPLWTLLNKIINLYQNDPGTQAKQTVLSDKTCREFSNIVSISKISLRLPKLLPTDQQEKQNTQLTGEQDKSRSGGHLLVMIDFFNQMIVKAAYLERTLTGDTNSVETLLHWIQPGSLIVLDLGFQDTGLFEEIVKKGADFIIPWRKRKGILRKETLNDTPYYNETLGQIKAESEPILTLRRIKSKSLPQEESEESERIFLVSVTDPEKFPVDEVIRCYDPQHSLQRISQQPEHPLCLSYLWSSKPGHIEIQLVVKMIAYQLYNRFRVALANESDVTVPDVSLISCKHLIKAFAAQPDSPKTVGWISRYLEPFETYAAELQPSGPITLDTHELKET